MQRKKRREVPADLSLAAERLTGWRRGRKRGDRIPAALWAQPWNLPADMV